MKTLIFGALCLVALTGCVREDLSVEPQKESVRFRLEVENPDVVETRVAFDGDAADEPAGLEWTGNETMKLLFGKLGEGQVDNTDNPTLASVAPGIFSGAVTLPGTYTLDDLQGFVVPGSYETFYDWENSTRSRIALYVPESQTQEKAGEPNWDYIPFFYDLSDGDLVTDEDGVLTFRSGITLRSTADFIRFSVYGKHPEMEEGEVLKSIRIKACLNGGTKQNIAGRSDWQINSTGSGTLNYGCNFVRVNLEEEVTVADKTDAAGGVKVFAAAAFGGTRYIEKVEVETDKAVYVKTLETPVSFPTKNVKKFNVFKVGLNLANFTTRTSKSSREWQINQIVRISGIPSLQVTYTKGDEVWESYIAVNEDFYGMYGVSQETQPLTTSSVYQAASISKPPLAYIALKVREEGKLDFDRPLYKYWGTYSDDDELTDAEEDASNGFLAKFADDASKEKAKQITALMVMHHKTGLDNSTYSNITYDRTPGGAYRYSGPAINLLDLTIGKILGKTLTEYGREYIFDKIGMELSSYQYEDKYDTIGVKGYRNDGSEWQRGNLKGPNAAYSMRTTADEYSKFLRWVLDGCDLNEESRQMYVDKYYNMNYDWEEWHNLIWRTEVNEELGDIVRHTGSNGFSFRGYVGFFPDLDATIVMFANSTSPAGYDHFSAVLSLFLGNKEPLASRASGKHIPEELYRVN